MMITLKTPKTLFFKDNFSNEKLFPGSITGQTLLRNSPQCVRLILVGINTSADHITSVHFSDICIVTCRDIVTT